MSAMTYQAIADLLADPVLGKLEALREYVQWRVEQCAQTVPHGMADAAILAVAVEQKALFEHQKKAGEGAAKMYEREKARADEAEALLNKAKAYVHDALWDEIHDWYARRAGGDT
jgi:hypothetical protein